MSRLLPAFAALLLSACVQFSWNKVSRYAPLDQDAIATLEPGRSDLGDCLELCGAPLIVLESDDGRGAVLIYAWYHENNRGLRLSTPVNDSASVDFDYDRFEANTPGMVLFFDHDWKLSALRQGLILDLTNDLRRRRPANV